MRRQARNTQKKDAFKRVVRDVRNLVEAKKNDDAKKLLPALYKTLDKAVKTNALKANTASRLKSRLTKLVAKK